MEVGQFDLDPSQKDNNSSIAGPPTIRRHSHMGVFLGPESDKTFSFNNHGSTQNGTLLPDISNLVTERQHNKSTTETFPTPEVTLQGSNRRQLSGILFHE